MRKSIDPPEANHYNRKKSRYQKMDGSTPMEAQVLEKIWGGVRLEVGRRNCLQKYNDYYGLCLFADEIV
jgi:hypothetical protein